MKYTLVVHLSSTATSVFLFNEKEIQIAETSVEHTVYNPQPDWVEASPSEILRNLDASFREIIHASCINPADILSLSITNQKSSVVVWNAETGMPVYNIILEGCKRGEAICEQLCNVERMASIRYKTGLEPTPSNAAIHVNWVLENVPGARDDADSGKLRMGTLDSWLIWNLSDASEHATDYTNASKTLLFNIHTLDWDAEILDLMNIPRSMLPEIRACDVVFSETTLNGLLPEKIPLAGVIGDSNAAFIGSYCFEKGCSRLSYTTSPNLTINIGHEPVVAPVGLSTTIGFSALGEVFYQLEGTVDCTDAAEEKEQATLVSRIYQVTDLINKVSVIKKLAPVRFCINEAGLSNTGIIQLQANLLGRPIRVSRKEETIAFGAALINSLALGRHQTLESQDRYIIEANLVYPLHQISKNKRY